MQPGRECLGFLVRRFVREASEPWRLLKSG